MKKIIIPFISLILITGCSTVNKITGPDGSEHLLIKGGSIEHCYEKAREACNGPYKIINSNSGSSETGTTFSLLVKCEPVK